MGKELASVYKNIISEYRKALDAKLKSGDFRGANIIQKKLTQLKRAMKRHSKKK